MKKLSILELLVLSLALGTDLFSLAIPIGMQRISLGAVFRSAAVFAAFHVFMILIGYYAGHWLGTALEHLGACHGAWPAAAVENTAAILGAAVLIVLGVHMMKNDLTAGAAHCPERDSLEGLALIMLAVSVSLDALAAGFGMGMIDVDLLMLSLILGTVIFSIGVAGLSLGRRIGRWLGVRTAFIGGAALTILGIHMLWTAIFPG